MSCLGNLARAVAPLAAVPAIEVGQHIVLKEVVVEQGHTIKYLIHLFAEEKEEEARATAALLVQSRSGAPDSSSEVARKASAAHSSIVASPLLDKAALSTVCGGGVGALLSEGDASSSSGFAESDKCPLAKLLYVVSSSPAAFKTFLGESIDVSCDSDRIAGLARKTEGRSALALERFLCGVTDASQLSTRLNAHSALDSEGLLGLILDLDAESKRAARGATPGAPACAPAPKNIEILLGNVDTSGTQEEKLERGAFRDAARAVCGDEAHLKHLRNMQDLVRKGQLSELLLECTKEEDTSMQLLFLSGVKDPYAALQGVLPDKEIALVCDVRAGLDSRLLAALFPDKQLFSDRQTKALQSVRVGRLLEVPLLCMLDIGEGGSAEDPLGCLASLGAEAETRFAQAMSLMGEAVALSLSNPNEVVSCMLWFRHFSELVVKYRGRGASWKMLSKLYHSVIRTVQKPAVAFSRGGMGDVGGASLPPLLDLRLVLFASNSEPCVKIEQEMVDTWMASRAPLRTLQPDLDRSKGAGKTAWLSPAKWSAACAALQEGVPPAQSQTGDELEPCRKFFIMGKCERGDDCPFHHEGEAGVYAPQ